MQVQLIDLGKVFETIEVTTFEEAKYTVRKKLSDWMEPTDRLYWDGNTCLIRCYDGEFLDISAKIVEEESQQAIEGPIPGTYAYTAMVMASIFPEEDWDAWKDQMKDRDL